MADHASKFTRRFRDINLDIRELKTVRVFDQKVTPDVVTTMADLVSGLVQGSEPFAVKDLWGSEQFRDAVTGIFSKRDPDDPKARLEYDKFIGQPLLALSYARVLDRETVFARRYQYRVADAPALATLAQGEMAAVDFLAACAGKVFADSGLGGAVEQFFQRQNQQTLDELRSAYIELAIAHTNIERDLEPKRIFPKMLNVLAFKRKALGQVEGRVTKRRITLGDVRYGRPNRLSTARAALASTVAPLSEQAWGRKTLVRVAMQAVKEHHGNQSEVRDSFAGHGGAEAHHIFPRSEYPEQAARHENIIVLTSSQHAQFAHPARTRSAARGYQLLCLLRKLDAILACEQDPECNFYSITDFIDLLADCGELPPQDAKALRHKAKFPIDAPEEWQELAQQIAEDLRRLLIHHYVQG